jgi:hypothetical protein
MKKLPKPYQYKKAAKVLKQHLACLKGQIKEQEKPSKQIIIESKDMKSSRIAYLKALESQVNIVESSYKLLILESIKTHENKTKDKKEITI